MFRPQIKVIDCSIRDGGLMNNSRFTFDMVQKVFRAVNESGVDIIEIGYKNSREFFSPSEYGPWRFCSDEDLKRVTDGYDYTVDIAVMLDSHKADIKDLNPKSESVVDMVRVATYVKDIDRAIFLANEAMGMGYRATINVMAISHALERELEEALCQVEEETKVEACYLVDSFGALYSEDIDYLVQKFKKYIRTKEIGIHCHNNQQLAFANTIEGIIKGANYLDGTLYGIGRAAGNCPLELLVAFLKNPKFNVRKLIDIIGREIMPMTKEMDWGYRIPYMISGILNVHPDTAIEIQELDESEPAKYDYNAFYEKMFAQN